MLPLPINNCVLSLGYGHSVGPRSLSHQTREKVCVWCVFESHTHSVSVQKLTFLIEKYTSFQIAIFLSKYD